MSPSIHSETSLPTALLFYHLELHDTDRKRQDMIDLLLIFVFITHFRHSVLPFQSDLVHVQ